MQEQNTPRTLTPCGRFLSPWTGWMACRFPETFRGLSCFLVERGVFVPFQGRVDVRDRELQQMLIEALAVGAVRHDHDAHAGFGEDDRVVLETVAVPFLER